MPWTCVLRREPREPPAAAGHRAWVRGGQCICRVHENHRGMAKVTELWVRGTSLSSSGLQGHEQSRGEPRRMSRGAWAEWPGERGPLRAQG